MIGVVAASLVAVISVFLALFFRTAPIEKPVPEPDCGTPPTADEVTGVVTNPGNLVMPDKRSCGENEQVLNALCLATRCLSPSCAPGTSWDAYNKTLKQCVKVTDPTCEQQACDAPYCTSASVINSLPPQHKLSAGGTCINPSETYIASQCNALPDHMWIFPDCKTTSVKPVIDTRTFQATTSQITGQMSYPVNAADSNLLFTYKLTTLNGTKTGTVSTRPDLGCPESSVICLAFTINIPSSTLLPGTYELIVYGKPSWSPQNTLQSVQPETIQLDTPTSTGVDPAMNPSPTRTVSSSTLLLPGWFTEALRLLKRRFPFLVTSGSVDASTLLMQPEDQPGSPFMTAAVTPNFAALEGGKVMPYKFVVLAWPAVSGCGADASVKYDVLRQRSNGVGAQAEVVVQGAVEPEMIDLVRVGDVWDYTLRAYVGTSYESATCRSEEVTITLVVTPFGDETCHQVTVDGIVGQSNPVPPWMWSTPEGCRWDTTNVSARDYYCAFEFNKAVPSFSKDQVYLFETSGTNKCGLLNPSYPQLSKSWVGAYCSCEAGDTTCKKDLCFNGLPSSLQRLASCNSALTIGTSASTMDNEGAFAERMSNLMNFYRQHNVHPSLDDEVSSIADTGEQLQLYSEYYNCGPDSDPKYWGSVAETCVPGDTSCVQAVLQGACDRNVCLPWTPYGTNGRSTLYAQTRTCYIDPEEEQSCCPEGKTYQYQPSAPSGVGRGSCQ
jgi:hypothetical protein